ncbi:hypothetical protein PIB30_108526, partial [Stylosanthes scabra]|nr:hypothetical protein [Stylosanthes scabra]
FAPKNSPCTQEISSVIKLMYDQPWPKWKAIPPSTRHRMYKKWAALYHFWETNEKYKHIEAMNKANRASERCAKYTGGSATPMQTKAKM